MTTSSSKPKSSATGSRSAKRKALRTRSSKAKLTAAVALSVVRKRRRTVQLAKRLEKATPVTGPAGVGIRPAHWRFCHAKLHLVESGKAPTVVAIAKELGINRVTLFKFLARYPWLNTWVNTIAREAAVEMHGLILKRHGLLAIQGSVPSADLFFKVEGGHYDRSGAGSSDLPGSVGGVTYNFLVPRPDYPQPQLPAATVQAPVSSIPRVTVR